jgi:hypothetical protein
MYFTGKTMYFTGKIHCGWNPPAIAPDSAGKFGPLRRLPRAGREKYRAETADGNGRYPEGITTSPSDVQRVFEAMATSPFYSYGFFWSD